MPRGVHASVRGSLKRGCHQRFHLLAQVHPTSPHGKAGPFFYRLLEKAGAPR